MRAESPDELESPDAAPRPVDLAVATSVTLLALAEILTGYAGGDTSVLLATGLPMTLILGIRRVRPVAALAVVLAAFVAQVSLGIEAGESGVYTIAAIAVAVASAASHLPRRAAVLTLVVTVAVVLGDIILVAHNPGDAPFGFVLVVAVWLVGRLLRDIRLRNAELELRNRQLAEERDAHARAVAALERARIARDLHDIVAHAVSVMVVQCGAARQVLRTDPDAAESALDAVHELGREALADMRRTVGVLRGDDEQALTEPQPGLAALEQLADHARRSGLDVHLDLSPGTGTVPAGLSLAAYRIVQEALTNIARHSHARLASVTVARDRGALVVEVLDPGPARTTVRSHHSQSGYGLEGMRERVELYGGTITAAPSPDGGYAVRATLPDADGRIVK